MSFRMVHERHAINRENGVLLGSLDVQNEAMPTVPEGQTEEWKALKPRVKAARVPKWVQRSQESIWQPWGEVGDGA
jgi:hypothetical protein